MAPGFTIDVYAAGMPVARQMALGSKGTLFVGTRNKTAGGVVYAVVDRNGDHKADQVFTIAKGLNEPNGVAFREGSLFVAEIHRHDPIARTRGIQNYRAVSVNSTFLRADWCPLPSFEQLLHLPRAPRVIADAAIAKLCPPAPRNRSDSAGSS